MTFSDLKIVRIMGRCNLNRTGSKGHIRMLISDNRDRPVGKRKLYHLADQILVTGILRIYCHCCISKKRFRSRGRNFNVSAFLTNNRILNMPEITILLLMDYLCIRQ